MTDLSDQIGRLVPDLFEPGGRSYIDGIKVTTDKLYEQTVWNSKQLRYDIVMETKAQTEARQLKEWKTQNFWRAMDNYIMKSKDVLIHLPPGVTPQDEWLEKSDHPQDLSKGSNVFVGLWLRQLQQRIIDLDEKIEYYKPHLDYLVMKNEYKEAQKELES